MSRMKILNAAERQRYEAPPIFDAAQRRSAFDLPADLLRLAKEMRKPAHRIGFLVSCGYFGASKRFFSPEEYHGVDIHHAAGLLDLPATPFSAVDYPERTRERHQHLILRFYGYRRLDAEAEVFLVREIDAMVTAHLKPA